MNKRGFTLVELLAIIVVLAIIALITIPVFTNIIENSNKSAFLRSVDGYVRAIQTEHLTEFLYGENTKDFVIIKGHVNGKSLVTNDREIYSGILNFNSMGGYFLILTNGKYCAYKNYSDKKPEIVDNIYCEIDLTEGIYEPIIEVQEENVLTENKDITVNFINNTNTNQYCIGEYTTDMTIVNCDDWVTVNDSMANFNISEKSTIYAKVFNDEKEYLVSKSITNIGEVVVDKTPTIDSLTLSAGDDYITVTVTASAYKDNEIAKYYYSINGEDYIESGNAYYTFENLEKDVEYEIKVYVEDDEERISDISSSSLIISDEEKIPTISLTTTSEENAITVTTTATAYNGATIEKYYYKIDDGEYIESNLIYHTFDDLEPIVDHKITVYVKDSNSLESKEEEISTKTTFVDKTPIIESLTLSAGDDYISATVSAKAYKDNEIVKYYYSINDEDYIEKTELYHIFENLEKDVEYEIRVYVEDNEGNISEVKNNKITIEIESEEKNPTITSLTTTSGEDIVIALVSAKAYGGSKIVNYYYEIDEEGYEQSTEKYYQFKGLEPFVEHIINVYVEDSEGRISEVSSIIVTTVPQQDPPVIESLTTTSGETSITVTVSATAYKNASITNYYYSINGEEYIESTKNYYNFEDLKPNKDYLFRVYVKDSNDSVSEIRSIKAITNADVPYLTIVVNNEGYEYNNELWYPYGTSITLNFAPDMKDSTGYYQNVNESSKTESIWVSNGTANKKNITLNESYTYRIKLVNKDGTESSIVEEKINIMPKTTGSIQQNYFKYNMGGIYPVYIPIKTNTTGTLYGTDYYGRNHQITKSAAHMGLISYSGSYTTEEKLLYVKLIPCPEGGYIKSTRNGKTTSKSSCSSSYNGYVFVTEDGTEIIGPKITGLTTSETEEDISVTVTTEAYNGATIEKYYYQIDKEEIIESTEPYYTFGNVVQNVVHKITVYVKDNNGAVSEIKSITAVTSNDIPLPVITLNQTGYEYNGELWYPSGTKVTITYQEDMTNLKGYYQTVNASSNEISRWTAATSSSYTTALTESMIYKVQIKDSAGREGNIVEEKINIMPSPTGTIKANYFKYNMEGIYPVYIPNETNTTGTLYGTDYYRDSNIAKAATHMGLMSYSGSYTTEEKLLYIKLVPCPSVGYIKSTRNGKTTSNSSCGNGNNGYVFVTEDGTEIIGPKITGLTTSETEEDISVTVTTEAYNGATIEKYYYQIDNEEIKESTDLYYTFENAVQNVVHTIHVYVKDSNGAVSEIKSITAVTSNDIPLPVITINGTGYEYNSELWYPYGTKITIEYQADMTNLKGYYQTINASSDEEGKWNSTTSSSYTVTLNESMIYRAQIKDSAGREGNIVEEKINIMPSPTGTIKANYFKYNMEGIYPVYIPSGTSTTATIYGTDYYRDNSSISSTAVHMGLMNSVSSETTESKLLYIKLVPCPEGGYVKSTKNGKTSSSTSCGSTNAYVFAKKDGTEIIAPKITGLTTTEYEDDITVSVTTEEYNGEVIERYYYQIDNGEVIESVIPYYTFENLAPYVIHTINVYVKDSNGSISEIATITSKTEREMAIPIITINGTGYEYNNELWYPYGTKITIEYQADMTSIKGYYQTQNVSSGEEGKWNSTTSSSYTATLNESMIYRAKIIDSAEREGNVVEEKINIMPSPTGTIKDNYYTYNMEGIYPVYVPSGTSTTATIYGTDYYRDSSSISATAVNMGLMSAVSGKTTESKLLYIKLKPCPSSGYVKSTRNGKTSTATSCGSTNAYVFVTKDGKEMIGPKVTGLSTTKYSDDIAVTTTATAYNGATIEKYYYQLDKGEVVESTEQHYTFKKVILDEEHTINVYVRDSNGVVSEISSTTATINSTVPYLSIRINDKGYEYNGELWYPSGTTITLNYSSSMTNLKGYYQTVNVSSSKESSWSSTTSSTKTVTLTESMIYRIKIVNSNGTESNIVEEKINIMPKENSSTSSVPSNYYTYNMGGIYPVYISGGVSFGTNVGVHGKDYYSKNSNISRAAAHVGLISYEGSTIKESKLVYIKLISCPEGGYIKSTRNGISATATSCSSSSNAFVFVTEDGTEILGPTITSLTTTEYDESITVTTTTESYNGQKVSKYYYQIDDEEIKESEKSYYTFENVTPYETHTINVYVKNGDGTVSEIMSVTAITEKEIPIPEITISGTGYEYNGELWYPSGTKIAITYQANMINLKGYHQTVNVSSGKENSWTSTTSSKYTTTLTESMIYRAKIIDNASNESDMVEKKINIMPKVNTSNSPIPTNYYTYNMGGIYPVYIAGGSSFGTNVSVHGTDYYNKDSNISKSAAHAGLIRYSGSKLEESKLLYIKLIPTPTNGYTASTRNGITSTISSSTNASNGFIFVTENGTEIIGPKIIALTKTEKENSIAVAVTTETHNNQEISKYYYQMDNGQIMESEIPYYVFEDATSYVSHTINVYVKTNDGTVSAISSITTKTTKEVPTPEITIDGVGYEYNGELWYPYGTKITVTYQTNMANLKGYYQNINVSSGKESSWSSTSSSSYTTTLSQSMIYKAKIADSMGRESNIVEEKINIMPKINATTNSIPTNYYTYNMGGIYPVYIAANSNFGSTVAVQGTDYYSSNTNISRAAAHMGLISYEGSTIKESKLLYIKLMPKPSSGYIASTRNGITSGSNGNSNGFIFVTETGQQITGKEL
ncbi:MAG: LCCL domain-containing protein [Clostridium sp.]|nr:LCCL domain-containing protein [Clostridium sp.]MCM1443852.1 LCCL domain-containing protein [Candidatus Amulumruptor caecigallinarius]